MTRAAAALLLLVFAAAPWVSVAQPSRSTDPTPLDVIASDDDLSTLLQAVNASSVIDLVISPTSKPVTIFGPSNEAFAALLAASNLTFAQVAALSNALSTTLIYHVVDGVYNQSNITDGAKLPTLLAKPEVTTAPVQYEELTAIVNATGIFLQGAANAARVLKTIAAEGVNGIVHVIDRVLQPPAAQLDNAYQLDDLAESAAVASSTFMESPPNITIINTTILNVTDINSTMVNGTNVTDATAGRRRML